MKIFQREMKNIKDLLYNHLNETTNQPEKKTKCNLFITSLEVANKRFSVAIIFSIIVILFIVLIYGFKALMASVIMLFAIPYLIARVESDNDTLIEYPFSKIKAKINFRDLYATTVWVVSLGTVFASSMLTW